jgi:hypothetical protein
MDLRLRTLESLDSRAVSLPHGTEVITRIDRVLDTDPSRHVPQGTVGRIVRSHAAMTPDGMLDVAIVGIGTLRYLRTELTPRRVGQALFAHRRHDAWLALSPCIVLETLVGSHAWGLADERSDEDRRGVFAHPFAWTQGLVAPPDDILSPDGAAAYWSVGKAMRQALRADPNTLEMLFLPSATAKDWVGDQILKFREDFVSIEIYGTFGRYALGQLRRLEQGLHLAEHRSTVLDWLREDPSLSLDAVAQKLAKINMRQMPTEADRVHQAKQYVKSLYRSMADQGLLEANEFAALVRFASEKSANFELSRELRPKNAYNLVRLLRTGAEWLRTGEPTFEATGAFREQLLAIKKGRVPLAEVLLQAEEMARELEEARNVSKLPERPNVQRIDRLLREIGDELAFRWVYKDQAYVSEPFGRSAPEPPEVTWNE